MQAAATVSHGDKVRKYSGDTFKTLIRQYSFDRMEYDPNYRRDVRKAKADKKSERKSHKESKADATNIN